MNDDRENLPSASAFRRFELCPGSFQLEQEAEKLNQLAHQGGEAAERGTLIHAYLAGQIDEDGSEIKLSDSEQTTADFLQERATGEVHRIFGDEPVAQLDERRLWLVVNGQKMASGRFDRVLYTASVALLQDFKTGFSEPDPAEQNAQLKVLAVLVALHMPPTLREVVCQVISGPHGITEARYDLPALAKAYSDILATLRALHAPDAPLVPSPDACRYCPAISICQKVRDLMNPITKLQTAALPDGARAARLLDECAVLQELIDGVKEYYSKRLTEDPAYKLPGYEMVPGVVRREVVDWEAARRRLGEWLELEDIEGAANYRLGDLEKALGKKLKIRGRELKARMNEILTGLIEERPNAASLKRVSGKAKLVEITLP